MNNGVYTVEFTGRTCTDCEVTFRQGYISSLKHPSEGLWDIKNESVGFINYEGRMEAVSVDPELENDDFKAMAQIFSETRKEATETQPATQEQASTFDPVNDLNDAIEYFPAWNLLIIVVTIILIAFAIPLWIKFYRSVLPKGQELSE